MDIQTRPRIPPHSMDQSVFLLNIFFFTPMEHSTVFKWANSGLFFRLFLVFFQTNPTILTTNQWEKCPSRIRIRRRGSNPRPLEYELSTITTRPGLQPWHIFLHRKTFCEGGVGESNETIDDDKYSRLANFADEQQS